MKTLVAVGNSDLYNKLKAENELNVFEKDIFYREGILEILKKENIFNAIIIYEKIIGEIDFSELINKIIEINNKIKIIIILENNKSEELINNKNIKKIFYNKDLNYKNFIEEIKNIIFYDENFLIEENEKLKKIILEKNKELKEYKKNNNQNNKQNKILIISEFKNEKLKKIQNKIKNKNNKIEYLNFNNLNKKINKNNYIVFLLNIKIGEIKKIYFLIKSIKENNLIENKKISLIFIEEKNSLCNLRLLKNIFYNYNIIGKIQKEKNDYLITKSIIRKINKIN